MPQKTAKSPKRLQYFQAPVQLLEDLRVLSERNERSLSAEIRVACRAHLDAHALNGARDAEQEQTAA